MCLLVLVVFDCFGFVRCVFVLSVFLLVLCFHVLCAAIVCFLIRSMCVFVCSLLSLCVSVLC